MCIPSSLSSFVAHFLFPVLSTVARYAALVAHKDADGTVTLKKEMKGLDLVRRDWCPISKEAGEKVLDFILSGEPSDKVGRSVAGCCGANGRTNERTNERTSERTNKRTNKRTNALMFADATGRLGRVGGTQTPVAADGLARDQRVDS